MCGTIAQATRCLIPQLRLLCARDILLPNEVWHSTLHSAHFLSIFQLKVSQLEQSNSLEISSWVAHREIYCIIARVQMICSTDLPVHSRWYSVPSGSLERGVWRCWKSKVRLVQMPCHSPFCCLCCAFSDSRAGCARWCIHLPALLSHEKSCEFPGIGIRPCPCQMTQLSCLTANSWSLFWWTSHRLCSHYFKLHHQGSGRAFQPTFTVLCITKMIVDYLWHKQDYSRAIRFGESKPSFLQQHGNFSVFSHRFWMVHCHAVIYLVKNQEGRIITLTEKSIIGNGDNSSITNHV